MLKNVCLYMPSIHFRFWFLSPLIISSLPEAGKGMSTEENPFSFFLGLK